MIKIHHVKEAPQVEADIKLYCGRGEAPHGLISAKVGNPFSMRQYTKEERELVISKYDKMLEEQPLDHHHHKIIGRIAERVRQGRSVALFCWCRPQACHCDVIKARAMKLL